MKNRRNYYRVLHIQPDAPLEIIKSSYRALLLQLNKHPDLGGNHWESALLNEAKEVLSDPRKRSKYDQDFLKTYPRAGQSKSPGTSAQIPPPPTVSRMHKIYSGGVFTQTCQFCHRQEQHSAPLTPDTRCSSCRSPLYPTRKIKISELAKRTFQRIAQDFAISYHTKWPSRQEYHGQASQLSPTGMQFFADQHLQPGQIIKIHSCVVEAVAKVVYCFASPQMNKQGPVNMTGVEFLAFISVVAPGTFLSHKT